MPLPLISDIPGRSLNVVANLVKMGISQNWHSISATLSTTATYDQEMPPLLVLDADSLAHRAYHAMPHVEGRDGRPVGLLLGFATTLVNLWRTRQPRTVLVCIDSRERSYRHELLPAYQGQRDPFAADLVEQLDRLAELTEAFGFASATHPPFEADDLLATAVHLEEAARGTCEVVTSDRDAFQLISSHTIVIRPGSEHEVVDVAGVRDRYGIDPRQVPDLIALRGDPSDNIPGARGIGQKTAAELLRRYGTLAGLREHEAELTPRQQTSIAEADLDTYLAIATMRSDLPLRRPPDASLEIEQASTWCAEQGMARMAARLAGAARA